MESIVTAGHDDGPGRISNRLLLDVECLSLFVRLIDALPGPKPIPKLKIQLTSLFVSNELICFAVFLFSYFSST